MLRAELTRLRNMPRHLARAQQAMDNVRSAKMRSDKICEALKGELREALALAEGRAASAAREVGGGDEVVYQGACYYFYDA